MRVLVVDDHNEVRELLERALKRDGHGVRTAASVAAAEEALAQYDVDVVVLDVGLPDGCGIELCRALRRSGRSVPVLMLTAQAQVARRIEGFDAGADDYLAKPFAVAELRARVRALGRRGPLPRGLMHRARDTEVDFAARRATVAGAEVPLTAREWAVLELLAARAGRVVPRAEILEVVWDEATELSSASLDVIVRRLRRKLGDGAVRTVRGEGYALGGD